MAKTADGAASAAHTVILISEERNSSHQARCSTVPTFCRGQLLVSDLVRRSRRSRTLASPEPQPGAKLSTDLHGKPRRARGRLTEQMKILMRAILLDLFEYVVSFVGDGVPLYWHHWHLNHASICEVSGYSQASGFERARGLCPETRRGTAHANVAAPPSSVFGARPVALALRPGTSHQP